MERWLRDCNLSVPNQFKNELRCAASHGQPCQVDVSRRSIDGAGSRDLAPVNHAKRAVHRYRDGSVASFKCRTSLSPSVCRLSSWGQIEKVIDELNLSKKIVSCRPSNLPLPGSCEPLRRPDCGQTGERGVLRNQSLSGPGEAVRRRHASGRWWALVGQLACHTRL
jgi:hypothetical protein